MLLYYISPFFLSSDLFISITKLSSERIDQRACIFHMIFLAAPAGQFQSKEVSYKDIMWSICYSMWHIMCAKNFLSYKTLPGEHRCRSQRQQRQQQLHYWPASNFSRLNILWNVFTFQWLLFFLLLEIFFICFLFYLIFFINPLCLLHLS